jgi:hypothetical protein
MDSFGLADDLLVLAEAWQALDKRWQALATCWHDLIPVRLALSNVVSTVWKRLFGVAEASIVRAATRS